MKNQKKKKRTGLKVFLSFICVILVLVGGVMIFVWKFLVAPMGGMFNIYELLPAFVFSVIVIVAVSLLTAEPDAQIEAEFDKVKTGKGLQ